MTLEINYQTNTISGLDQFSFSNSTSGNSLFANIVANTLNITGGNSNFVLTPTVSGSNIVWHAGNLNPASFATTASIPTSATFLPNYDVRYVNKSGDTINGSLIVNSNLTSSKYFLGADLSIVPIAGNQSGIGTWWGLQLVGNRQSDITAWNPTPYGNSNSYGVILSSDLAPAVSTVAIYGVAGQTTNLLNFLDTKSSGITLAYVNISGGATFSSVSSVSIQANNLIPALSGNFLTWDQNNNLVDSNNIFSRTVTISSSITNMTGADLVCLGTVNPLSLVSELRDDFISSTSAGVLGWANVINGAGATTSVATNFLHTTTERPFGVVRLQTGTNAAGRANINLGIDVIQIGYGEFFQRWRSAFDTLSTATDRYVARFGFMDQNTNTDNTDGIYFEYDEGTAGNFWRICTAKANVRTKTTTTAPVQITSFDHLWIYIPSNASRADFYVNRNFVGTINTNIPNTAGTTTGIGATITKTAGTNNRSLYFDYFVNKYTTTRL